MPKISVIMPSLNVADYIESCIHSAMKQTLRDIEIICVDAGSTDGTVEILEKCAKKDNRIQIIHSDIKSYGYQMNLGLRKATGEFIAFLDTDDLIREDMYDTLYSIAVENEVDFVKADFTEIRCIDGEIKDVSYKPIIIDINKYNQVIDMCDSGFLYDGGSVAVWAGIYRKSFLDRCEIFYNETPGASFQDTSFWFQVYALADTGYFVDKPFYRYRIDNPNSSVKQQSKVYCICDEFDFVYDKLVKTNKLEAEKDDFCKIFYRKYRWNQGRLTDECRIDFIKRFAKDFNDLKDKGLLDLSVLKKPDAKLLYEIMTDPEKFANELISDGKEFWQKVSEQDKIIVYGSGIIGKIFYNRLDDKDKVVCFADTVREVPDRFDGKDIISINDVKDKDSLVVVTVKDEDVQKQMKAYAESLGFDRVITVAREVYF